MQKIPLIYVWLMFGISSFVQSQECSTIHTSGSDTLQQLDPNEFIESSNNYVVRVYFHIMRKSDGSGGLTNDEVDDALNRLVADFEPLGICISLVGMDEVRDTYIYYEWDEASEIGAPDTDGDGKFQNLNFNSHSNAIDIYLFGTDGSMWTGWSANVIATSVAVGGIYRGVNFATSHYLSHEVAHCLGLFHTYHGTCGSGCTELVDGSNCGSCGDFVCDTPADPINAWGNVHYSTCIWNGVSCTGFSTDVNGDPYAPSVDNIMSAIPVTCPASFTNNVTSSQGLRMRDHLANISLLQNIIVPNSLTISSLNVTTGVKLFDVLNDLTAQTNVTVQSGATLKFRAGEDVYLKPGFHAQSNSAFSALINSACSTIDEDNSAKGGSKNITHNNSKEKKIYSNLNIQLFPNPTSSILNFKFYSDNSNQVEFKILNTNGIVCKVFKLIKSQNISINVKDLPVGLYILNGFDGKNSVSEKFVKVE